MRATLLALAWLAGCSSLSPGDFTPPFEQTSMVLETLNPDGRVGVMTAEVEGTREVGRTTLPVLTLRYPVGPNTAEVEIVGRAEPDRLTLGGFTVPHTDYGLGVDLTFDRPLEIDLTGKVGEPVTTTIEGGITFGDPAFSDPGYLPFDVTTTLLEVDATASSVMGEVPGCSHVALALDTQGISGSGEVWVRPDRGLVHAVFDTVPFGRIETGPSSWTGFADAGRTRIIQREGILDNDHTSFVLSTQEVSGEFDADKNTHAQMWLELRWADADKARTIEPPVVDQSFGTVFGFFPSDLVRTDGSVLHPSDNDEGYTYWGAFVDQAAKNEAENGIAYSVSAYYTGGDAVSVGAFIRYARVP